MQIHLTGCIIFPGIHSLSIKQNIITGIEYAIASLFHMDGYLRQIIKFRLKKILV